MERGVAFTFPPQDYRFPLPSRLDDVIEEEEDLEEERESTWDYVFGRSDSTESESETAERREDETADRWPKHKYEESLREKEINRRREVRKAHELERQRDVRMAAAAKEKMKEVLKVMGHLPRRISDLLRPERGHDDLSALARRGFVFMETELSTIVAALQQLLASAERIGPGHVDPQTVNQMAYLIYLARWTDDLIDGHAPVGAETELRELNLACIEQLLLVIDGADDQRAPPPAAPDVAIVDPPSTLVGIDGPREKLVRWLTASGDGEARVKVLSVVGPAGMGKTTLAMDVFRQIGGQFQCRAVARLSPRPPHPEKLLRHIMSQIAGSQAAATLKDDECVLAYEIGRHLKNKRYLILIDDIWRTSDLDLIWDALYVLPVNRCHSRIIITTRIRSVARSCCSHPWPNGLVHEVRPLSAIDSERLFSAAAHGYRWCANFARVANETLMVCHGTPQLIIDMAGLMSKQKQEDKEEESEAMVDSSRPCAAYLPSRISELKQVEATLLSPSYDNLPSELRLLSLYMSTFPQGYVIDKHMLIRKWKAEGLITVHTFQSGFEEIAEKCFSELVQRYIIYPVRTRRACDCECNPCSYQVNHFMFRLLASKSAEKNFVTTGCDTFRSSEAATAALQLRRVFIRGQQLPANDLKLPAQQEEMSRARSLTVSGRVDNVSLDMFPHLVVLDLQGWDKLKDEALPQIFSSDKLFLLRYLSLRNTRVSELPPEIGKLSSLETLDASHTQIAELPPEVCTLRSLEELDLRCTRILQLPERIDDLLALRHLRVGGGSSHEDGAASTRIPNGISWETLLDTLETLAAVDLRECPASVVKDLSKLRCLEVLAVSLSLRQCAHKEYQSVLLFLVQRLKCLRSLTIRCDLGCSMEFLDFPPSDVPQDLRHIAIHARFLTVPRWIAGLHHLASLHIRVCKLAPEDVKILGSLHRLECLELGLDFLPKEAIVIECEEFSPQNNTNDTALLSSGNDEEEEENSGIYPFRELQRFSVDCRVPWLAFKEGAMAKLTDLELKLSTGPASHGSVPSGITNLLSLEQVAIQYDAWYINSRSVRAAVDAVRRQVAELQYTVKLINNGVEEDVEAIIHTESAEPTAETTLAGAGAEGEAKSQAQLC